MFRKMIQTVFVSVLLVCMTILSTGCSEAEIRHITGEINTVQSQVATIADAIGQAAYDDDETLNLLRAIRAGNTASTPFNPYALPIGAGLSGVIALLESLRRHEKGKRKWAEHELNNGRNSNHG